MIALPSSRSFLYNLWAFASAYGSGGLLLLREARVAAKLVIRIYFQRHRHSRREMLLMRQSAADVAKALPMAGLILTLGLEISTLVVLRGMPGLLPSALQRTVLKTDVAKHIAGGDQRISDQAEATQAGAQKRLEAVCRGA
jgi:hypothetical protein